MALVLTDRIINQETSESEIRFSDSQLFSPTVPPMEYIKSSSKAYENRLQKREKTHEFRRNSSFTKPNIKSIVSSVSNTTSNPRFNGSVMSTLHSRTPSQGSVSFHIEKSDQKEHKLENKEHKGKLKKKRTFKKNSRPKSTLGSPSSKNEHDHTLKSIKNNKRRSKSTTKSILRSSNEPSISNDKKAEKTISRSVFFHKILNQSKKLAPIAQSFSKNETPNTIESNKKQLGSPIEKKEHLSIDNNNIDKENFTIFHHLEEEVKKTLKLNDSINSKTSNKKPYNKNLHEKNSSLHKITPNMTEIKRDRSSKTPVSLVPTSHPNHSNHSTLTPQNYTYNDLVESIQSNKDPIKKESKNSIDTHLNINQINDNEMNNSKDLQSKQCNMKDLRDSLFPTHSLNNSNISNTSKDTSNSHLSRNVLNSLQANHLKLNESLSTDPIASIKKEKDPEKENKKKNNNKNPKSDSEHDTKVDTRIKEKLVDQSKDSQKTKDSNTKDLRSKKKHEESEKKKEELRKQIYAQNRLMRFITQHQWSIMEKLNRGGLPETMNHAV